MANYDDMIEEFISELDLEQVNNMKARLDMLEEVSKSDSLDENLFFVLLGISEDFVNVIDYIIDRLRVISSLYESDTTGCLAYLKIFEEKKVLEELVHTFEDMLDQVDFIIEREEGKYDI